MQERWSQSLRLSDLFLLCSGNRLSPMQAILGENLQARVPYPIEEILIVHSAHLHDCGIRHCICFDKEQTTTANAHVVRDIVAADALPGELLDRS